MKKISYAVLLVLLLCAGVARAQTTTATATIVDSAGVAWINAPYTIQLQSPIQPVTSPGNNTFTYIFSGFTNGSGALSQVLQSVANIYPANTTWQFCVTPGVTSWQQFCVNVPVGNVGQSSEDVSTQINAVIRPPIIPSGVLAQAYADSEVISVAGAQYYNVTSSTFRCYTASWAACGGGGGSSGGVFYVQNYYSAGATVDTWVNACLAAATTAGGLCDTTALSGQTLAWAFNTQLTIGNSSNTPVALRLPCSGQWNMNLSGGTADMIDQYPMTAIYDDCGAAPGNAFNFKNVSGSGGANYGYRTIPPTTSGGNVWYYTHGFGILQVASGTSFASGIEWSVNAGEDDTEQTQLFGLDGSSTDTAIFQVTAQNSGTKACCNAKYGFYGEAAYTGPTGIKIVGVPTNLFPIAVTFEGANAQHPRSGQPNISCTDTNSTPQVTAHITDTTYLELSNVDVSSPAAIQVNGCAMFTMDNLVAKAEANATTRQVINISNAWNSNVHIGSLHLVNGSGYWTYPNTQAIVNANGSTVPTNAAGDIVGYDSLTHYFENVSAQNYKVGTNTVIPSTAIASQGSSTGGPLLCASGGTAGQYCGSDGAWHNAAGAAGTGSSGSSGTGIALTGTSYAPVFGNYSSIITTAANAGQTLGSLSQTVNGLQVTLGTALSASQTLAVTLYDVTASAAQVVTCTIPNSGTTCADTTDAFNVPAGHLVAWQMVLNTGTATTNVTVGSTIGAIAASNIAYVIEVQGTGQTIATGTTVYSVPVGPMNTNASSNSRSVAFPRSGTIANLTICTDNTQPGTGTLTAAIATGPWQGTLSATSQSVTVAASATAGCYTTAGASLAYTAGQGLAIQLVEGTGTSATIGSISAEFTNAH